MSRDGDQVGVRGVFSVEANKELEEFRHSKRYFLTLGGVNNKVSSNEAIQSLFNLTLILPEDKVKLSNPKY